MRRALRVLSSVLIVAGVLLLVDAGLTVAWQEPVSAVMAKRAQSGLKDDLRDLETQRPSPLELRALDALPTSSRRVAFLARRLKRRADDGAALGRIRIDRIGADFVVVNGDDPAALRRGPGLYTQTPLPGAGGTTAIAGHRTTYGAPFRKVDKLRGGDRIELRMPYATFTYIVEGRPKIVPPTQTSVIRRVGYDRLVLTACHPLYSAAERIVVFARLARVAPAGAAVRGRGERLPPLVSRPGG